MAEPLPRRLAGYGAYNLAFDNMLGRRNPAGPNFFRAIRNQLGLRNINLVRVICFRYSRTEGLPAGRATPLYVNPGGGVTVNEAFLRNLNDLVTSAEELNFWVQVSIFHYHAIATPEGKNAGSLPEVPELLPKALIPDTRAGVTPCQRLRKFFHPNPADPAQLTRQKELVAAIVGKLAGRPKVIYEIGNELRVDTQGCTADDNCRLAEWMNVIKAEILRVDPTALVGSSTGRHGDAMGANEEEVFSTCAGKLVPAYFDFHFLEWNNVTASSPRIAAAAGRAQSYLSLPTTTAPPLIIDDDGARDADRTVAHTTTWSTSAFRRGLHYATKNSYPNGGTDPETGAVLDFNGPVIRALDAAAGSVAFPPPGAALIPDEPDAL